MQILQKAVITQQTVVLGWMPVMDLDKLILVKLSRHLYEETHRHLYDAVHRHLYEANPKQPAQVTQVASITQQPVLMG